MKETHEVGEKVDVLYFSFSKNGKSVIIKVSEGILYEIRLDVFTTTCVQVHSEDKNHLIMIWRWYFKIVFCYSLM